MKTNREKYKDAFKVLHTSKHFHVEVESMKGSRKTAFGFMAKRTLIRYGRQGGGLRLFVLHRHNFF